MRVAFTNTLFDLATHNKDILLLTGDLGYSIFERWKEHLPQQYLNTGIAEQNMTGVAAGMAMEGKIPFVYSIIPFVTMRNFEQVRNDICYQDLNVKLVGVGAGFSYGPYGHTHHALEDLGIMRTLPNMTIFAPGDPIETDFVVRQALSIKGPVYIRLGKAGDPTVHQTGKNLRFGKGAVIRKGKEVTIIATSTMLYTGYRVVERLNQQGISAGLISMHTIKPFDADVVIAAAKDTPILITLEEHSIINGLGTATAEIVAESGIEVKLKRLGVPDRFTKVMGLQEHMRDTNGLTEDQVLKSIIAFLK